MICGKILRLKARPMLFVPARITYCLLPFLPGWLTDIRFLEMILWVFFITRRRPMIQKILMKKESPLIPQRLNLTGKLKTDKTKLLKIKVKNSGVVKLQTFIDKNGDGDIFIAEATKNIPFKIKRVFFIRHPKIKKSVRGRH